MASLTTLLKLLQEKDPNDPMSGLLQSRMTGQSSGSATSGLRPGTISPDFFGSRGSMLDMFSGRMNFINNKTADSKAATDAAIAQRAQAARDKALLAKMKAMIPKPLPKTTLPKGSGNGGGGVMPPPPTPVPVPIAPPEDKFKLPEIAPQGKTHDQGQKDRWSDYERWACRTYGVCK